MRRPLLALIAGAVAVGAFGAAQPAAAARNTRLTVAVRPVTGPVRLAWLSCQPTTGNHRNADAACGVLVAAGGDPRRIPPADAMCTMEYAPVRIRVTGRWHGRAVRYQATFGNGCVLHRELGPVGEV